MAESKETTINTKKRKRTGRMSDVLKKLRLQNHELGDDCKCDRFKCFEMTSKDQRTRIISQFNSFATRYDQDNYLSGLITVSNAKRRRPRLGEENAKLHNKSYSYKIRMIADDTYEIPVCRKAFLSLHGITGRRLQFIQKSLTEHGVVQKDKRGTHVKTQLPKETTDLMYKQIDTLKSVNEETFDIPDDSNSEDDLESEGEPELNLETLQNLLDDSQSQENQNMPDTSSNVSIETFHNSQRDESEAEICILEELEEDSDESEPDEDGNWWKNFMGQST
ncbi:unnamed protein product [Parnassius apollo]|uniref:(apollo) hypothetical protein n=1 Tax=Parnassius apollo TaxID=110799 RepID=A0A8S3X9S7_PARAO|nr:unnamed protein product [Parnassius apollo]